MKDSDLMQQSALMNQWRRRREQVEMDTRLKAGARLLGVHLVDCCGKHGACYPTNEELGKKYNRHSRTIRAYIRQLELLGHIHVRHLNQGTTLPNGKNEVVERVDGIRVIYLASMTRDPKALPGRAYKRQGRTSSETNYSGAANSFLSGEDETFPSKRKPLKTYAVSAGGGREVPPKS